MKKTKTDRGFALNEFTDYYGLNCSIQKSSLATEDAIWFGINDPKMKIMAKEAHLVGIETEETTGWIDIEIPEQVLIDSRMHLTREQVIEILPILQKFAKTGEI